MAGASETSDRTMNHLREQYKKMQEEASRDRTSTETFSRERLEEFQKGFKQKSTKDPITLGNPVKSYIDMVYDLGQKLPDAPDMGWLKNFFKNKNHWEKTGQFVSDAQ